MKLQFEQVHPESHESFNTISIVASDFKCPYHFHPELELTYIEHGHGTRIIGSQLADFYQGDLMLIGANVPHWYYNAPESSQSKNWARAMVVQFRPDFLGETFLQTPEVHGIRKTFEAAKAGIQISGKTNHLIVEKLRQLQAHTGFAKLLIFIEILHCIDQGREDLTILKQESHATKFDHNDVLRFDQIFRYLNKHASEEIRLEDIANVVKMTPTAFSRFYKQKTGNTFQQTVIEIRLLDACQQLITTDSPITEICFAAGFNNLSNFNRLFKRNKGCSPKAFRKQWQ